MIYSCCNENRRNAVIGNLAVNGIDYLEVLDHAAIALNSPRQQTLLVHCLNPIDTIPASWGTSNILIQGGESITGIVADWVAVASLPATQAHANALEQKYFHSLPDAAKTLIIRTSEAGDFSPYTLRLVNDAATAAQDAFEIIDVLAPFDPQLDEVEFSFKVECGPNFDCQPASPDCNPAAPTPPPINYLAKDYGSFRTLILDRLSQLIPNWGATSEADFGIALAELVSYVGDRLSYQQDAVATEAYIETARSRISLRRHALLVDYHVHDGANARVWMKLDISGGSPVFLDRTVSRFYTTPPPGPIINLAVNAPNAYANAEAALAAGMIVFQPMYDAILYPRHNRMHFYAWGDTECCLPQGSTEATLFGSFADLQKGDVLIFQEMKGPLTGNTADADLRHRCAVRLTNVATTDSKGNPLTDPLFKDHKGNTIVVTEIQWDDDDALPFPVCISSVYVDSTGAEHDVTDVTAVFGNVVLADHGIALSGVNLGTVPAPKLFYAPSSAADRCQFPQPVPLPVRFRPPIPDSPLTQAVPLATATLANFGNPATTAPILLSTAPSITLNNASGYACLTLQSTNPASWPQLLGVVVNVNSTNSANYDLAVVYNAPQSAKQVTLESFANLSVSGAPAQINSESKLISVPSTFVPPSAPLSGFPSTPTMLSNTGPVNLQDLSHPAITYLTIQPTNPSSWQIAVTATPDVNPAFFDLKIIYEPTPAVPLEDFTGQSMANGTDAAALESAVNGISEFIAISGYAQTADTSLSAAGLMNFDATQAVPAISLAGMVNQSTQAWAAVPDLLESAASDPHFVVEIEYTGAATLRFGDNTNGKTPETGTSFLATYRIGNGSAGNVGAESLVKWVGNSFITSCTNPLPAAGGTDPETNDQIRRRAPQAFLTQDRAVTMTDYEAITEQNPQVEQAVASLRWTGSWYTVFIAVEPEAGGNLATSLQKTLKQNVERYRLAGQDLELDSPQYLSLEIELTVCVNPTYFMADVEQALLQVLGSGIQPNGQKGLFYQGNFTFGQTVYLSPVYAAARSVAGVVSVVANKFQPQGMNTTEYLNAGEIELGPLQVARLENDPSYPDHGQLTLIMEGGK